MVASGGRYHDPLKRRWMRFAQGFFTVRRHDPAKLTTVLLDLAHSHRHLAQLPVTLAVANGLEPDDATALIGSGSSASRP